MIDGVSLFICCLYWSSGKPVGHLDLRNTDWNSFDVQPMNVHERLNYILIRPEQYHSFVQLDQLFQECEKQFSKIMTLKNTNKKTQENRNDFPAFFVLGRPACAGLLFNRRLCFSYQSSSSSLFPLFPLLPFPFPLPGGSGIRGSAGS